MLIPGTSLWASTTTKTVRVYNKQYVHDNVQRILFAAFSALLLCCCNTCSCCCCCSHINSSLQCSPWSQDRPQKLLFCSACTEYYALLRTKQTLAVRRSDMLPVRTFKTSTVWRGECLCHRPLGVWLF